LINFALNEKFMADHENSINLVTEVNYFNNFET